MGKRAQRKARREARRRNQYYLWGVLALVAVAIVVGIVLANRPNASATGAGADTDTAIADSEWHTTETGLEYRVFEEGDGPQPQVGDTVTVKYAGTLEDGTEFDSGEYTFVLGMREVIAGWDEGIALLKQGTHAELRIPPDLAYGPGGSGAIPPNATLIFDVELLEVQSAQ
jgi:FKBP-type peptidyl-prolyl cis-trans isomerase